MFEGEKRRMILWMAAVKAGRVRLIEARRVFLCGEPSVCGARKSLFQREERPNERQRNSERR